MTTPTGPGRAPEAATRRPTLQYPSSRLPGHPPPRSDGHRRLRVVRPLDRREDAVRPGHEPGDVDAVRRRGGVRRDAVPPAPDERGRAATRCRAARASGRRRAARAPATARARRPAPPSTAPRAPRGRGTASRASSSRWASARVSSGGEHEAVGHAGHAGRAARQRPAEAVPRPRVERPPGGVALAPDGTAHVGPVAAARCPSSARRRSRSSSMKAADVVGFENIG